MVLLLAGLPPDAAERSRTSTTREGHKALNLARLPVPPQPRGTTMIVADWFARERWLQPSGGRATLRTCVRPSQEPHSWLTRRTERTNGPRQGPDQAPARDLRLHQPLPRQARLPAHCARDRQGGRAALL